jgi:hypothetical protein
MDTNQRVVICMAMGGVRLALKLGSMPIVKDWMMTAGGIKAREIVTGKLSTCVFPRRILPD